MRNTETNEGDETMTWTTDTTFEVSGETYRTDTETVAVLHSVERCTDAFAAMMFLGLRTGRIVKVA